MAGDVPRQRRLWVWCATPGVETRSGSARITAKLILSASVITSRDTNFNTTFLLQQIRLNFFSLSISQNKWFPIVSQTKQ
jgi:hypothetical protein